MGGVISWRGIGPSWRRYHDATHLAGNGSPGPPHGMTLEEWIAEAKGTEPVKPELSAGEYYPRIWRGGAWPKVEETSYVSAWRDSVRVTRMLGARLKAIFDAIEPVRAHDNVYGHELRMLLLLACNEVESSCKAILTEHEVHPIGDRYNMRDYRKLAPIMRLGEYEIRLSVNPDYGAIVPFGPWTANPSASLPWYQAHHEVKHDRETRLDCASFGNTVTAVAAAFILRLAQFGMSLGEKFVASTDAEGFDHLRQPSWTDFERYVAPSDFNATSPLFGAPVPKRHPGLQ